jgi:hypothetical protein
MKRIVLLSLLLFPIFLFAQYPTFSNKQKLGVQTTGDGLIYRGRNNPNYYTPSNINNAYFYLDTLTSKLYLYNISDWQQIYPTTSDTTSLGNFLLKSDTLAMLLPYLRKADTISLSNRINKKLDTIYIQYPNYLDTILNKDTINITTLEAGLGINIANNIISLDTILLDSIVSIKNVYVKNGTGTILNKGEAVYVTGADGTNIIVGRASNIAESSSSKTLGLTMTSIPVNGFGYVVKEGLLAGLNTNSANAGDPVWLSNTPGGLIFGLTNKPYAPNHLVYLGIVTRKQQNNGEIYVTVQNGFEIKELHDVQITDPVNKASLYYNSSENLWKDTTATLLVSDTTSMLSNYATKIYTDTSYLKLTGGTLTGSLTLSNLNGNTTRMVVADSMGLLNTQIIPTGTVTNVTGILPISISNGTTTPSISVLNATATTSGVVSAVTQSFGGSKTFTGIVTLQRMLQRPIQTLSATLTSISTASTWIISNIEATAYLIFPTASTSKGTEYYIKTTTNNAVSSYSSNIVPLIGGSPTSDILPPVAGKWATVVSDGTNWVIMQSN